MQKVNFQEFEYLRESNKKKQNHMICD